MFRAALDEGDDVDKVPLAAGWCGGYVMGILNHNYENQDMD
jgi:hypothetical protein